MVYDRRPDDMKRITDEKLAEAYIEEQVQALRDQIGDKKVLLASLSILLFVILVLSKSRGAFLLYII